MKFVFLLLFASGGLLYYFFFNKVGNLDNYQIFSNELKENEITFQKMNFNQKMNFINSKVKVINEKISCEILKENKLGTTEIVLTTNGNKDAFSSVDRIVNLDYNRNVYYFIALRQMSLGYLGIEFNGFNLKTSQLGFVPLELPEGLAIKFVVDQQFSNDYKNFMESYGPMAIDYIIGERNFAEIIYAYDFYFKSEILNTEKVFPISELNEYLLNRKSKQ